MSKRDVLWQPSQEQIEQTNISRFINYINQHFGRKITNYEELYQWSIDFYPEFWSALWYFTDIIHSQPYSRVVANATSIMNARWFVGARLNFAENLLRYRDDEIAVISYTEQGWQRNISYRQLYLEVARLALSLKSMGVQEGDRIAGYMPNTIEAIVQMLAAASLGAVWSACSPDYGPQAVIDRFGLIEPRVLFCSTGYQYNGKSYNSIERVEQIIDHISSIEMVIVVPGPEETREALPERMVWYHDFISLEDANIDLDFVQLPFDHPLYIMYSSSPTDSLRCIVHGAGGTLIQHLKEIILNTDLKREDILFYYTTGGWMIWNWLVACLAVGATVVLYDGSPFYPHPAALFDGAEALGVTVFGTSARYLSILEKNGIKPCNTHDLSKLQTILSTGSPLLPEQYTYVYRDIKDDVLLASILGGTDIFSCFALGNPIDPVYEGELQCRGLGMRVEVFNEAGQSIINRKGELVCTAPFPSRPLRFWNDPDSSKYHQSYFEVYPEVWHQGDFAEITDAGRVIIYGRSDDTLNPGGVRISSSEIYRQIASIPMIEDSLVVGQQWQGDIRIILFVKLKAGVEMNEMLQAKIRHTIKQNTTPRHVPAKIIPVADLPYTMIGKKVEAAVRSIIHNVPVTNPEILANPESLECYRNLAELQR